jgi:hypothetical protein
MELELINLGRAYPRDTQVVYKGLYHTIIHLEPFKWIALRDVAGNRIDLPCVNAKEIYLYEHNVDTLKRLYRAEKLGKLKKFRLAESRDSGRTWDFVAADLKSLFPGTDLIYVALDAIKKLKKKLEDHEKTQYLSRLNQWEPV